jgi:hypothetical protein
MSNISLGRKTSIRDIRNIKGIDLCQRKEGCLGRFQGIRNMW